jgi:hypothetical protein
MSRPPSFFCKGIARPPKLIVSTALGDGNTTSATADFVTAGVPLALGDIVLVYTHVAGGGDGVYAAAPDGTWNIAASVEDTGGNNSASRVFWKRWTTLGDDDTPTFTASAGSVTAIGQLWRFCASAGSPITATPGTNHGASGTTLTGGSSTAPRDRCSAVVFFGCLTAAGNISGTSGTFYSTMYSGASFATTAGPDRAFACAYNSNVPAGATGSGVTATATVSMTAWSSITIILNPASQ